MFPFLWYLQSAVGFEYQGKTEKHASQRGKLCCAWGGAPATLGARALSPEGVSWAGPCSLSIWVVCHPGASQPAAEAAFSPSERRWPGRVWSRAWVAESSLSPSGGTGALSSLMLCCACGPQTAPADLQVVPVSESLFWEREHVTFSKPFLRMGLLLCLACHRMAPGAGALSVWPRWTFPVPLGRDELHSLLYLDDSFPKWDCSSCVPLRKTRPSRGCWGPRWRRSWGSLVGDPGGRFKLGADLLMSPDSDMFLSCSVKEPK